MHLVWPERGSIWLLCSTASDERRLQTLLGWARAESERLGGCAESERLGGSLCEESSDLRVRLSTLALRSS
jgi:hypothetical protein